MGTIAEKLQKRVHTKESIRQAIIGKGQNVTASDTFASYPAKIAAIKTGTDISDATATAADLRSGKIAYGKDGKVVGSVPDIEISTPVMSMTTSGNITATVTQNAGYIAAGTKKATYTPPTMSGQTITPSSAPQTIATEGKYMLGDIIVSGDVNLQAANIKKGVSIFGKTGTYAGSDAVIEPLDASNFSMSISSSNVNLYINTAQNIQKFLSVSLLLKGSILLSGPLIDPTDDTYLYFIYMCHADRWRAYADYDKVVSVTNNEINITLTPKSTQIDSFLDGLLDGTVVYIPA